jgi:hypothetical protein
METVWRPFGKPRLRPAPRERTPIPSVHDCAPEAGPVSPCIDVPTAGAWSVFESYRHPHPHGSIAQAVREWRTHRVFPILRAMLRVARMPPDDGRRIVRGDDAPCGASLYGAVRSFSSRFPRLTFVWRSRGSIGQQSDDLVSMSIRPDPMHKVKARKGIADGHGELMRVLTSKTV